MIKEIIDYEDLEVDNTELFEKLIKDFNYLTQKNNSRCRIYFNDNFTKLILIKFLIPIIKLGNDFPNIEINYNSTEKHFYFKEGIDKSIFEEIKFFLITLEQEFLVEVRE